MIDQLVKNLEFANPRAASQSLEQIQQLGIPEDLWAHFAGQLEKSLGRYRHPDRILANLHRFLEASRSPQAWLSLFEREDEALTTLLQLVSTSQYIADLLIRDTESFELVRVTDGQPVDRRVLQDEVAAEVTAAANIKSVQRILRAFRHRETMRIAYGDFINRQPIDIVISQLSILADSIIQAAILAAQLELARNGRPSPKHADGTPVRFSVLALGKLGGEELNYSSDVDLLFIRQRAVSAPNRRQTKSQDAIADEYIQRLAQLTIKLLSEATSEGLAYRVDARLRPHGNSGKLVSSYDEAVRYYDTAGRTWERQAFVKARPVAADLELGRQFIDDLQSWIYRRHLMRADITGLIALKRRIERRSLRYGESDRNVKMGRGGLRDIEYVIQFLQLLHGADQPQVRCTPTLEAIRRLQAVGCLTTHEQIVLEDNYRYLRSVEHHLQIMYDRQTHTLPEDPESFHQLAASLLDDPSDSQSPSHVLREELARRTSQNRQILDHLLHNAFSGSGYDETQLDCPESDLILDPEPSVEVIESTLKPYGFADCRAAYRNLQELAVESIPFLSTRRSRHFLAAIAPKLLSAIAATPHPDRALINLANVSASLGGKAVLWELFSENPPSLELCVRLCATSPYLTSILTSNPGMIDELLDSLMLESLPTQEELSESLDELCRGAVDISPILHSFKSSMHLRVGVRDILGKSTIEETHTALSDIAEVCLEQVIHHEFHRLVHRLGVPTTTSGEGSEEAAELIVLAVGKLGGREPNYHSDLDVIFLFDGEGSTKSLLPNRRFEATTNRHFFQQLCQNVIHALTRSGPTGQLYEMDVRLRPLGRSGQLVITIQDLKQYFDAGGGQIWERQALCKARPIWGRPRAREQAMRCVQSVLSDSPWEPEYAQKILDHRLHLQKGAADGNLKRGEGGTMDVEFVVQLLQLAHAKTHPGILVPGTLDAINRLREAGLLDPSIGTKLHDHYQFLRSIESGIRLMKLSARHELPDNEDELEQLAFLLKSENRLAASGTELEQRCRQVQQECRAIFDTVFEQWLPKNETEDLP